ncbi:MAG: tetratricopeptide repeat protein [Clostridium sp.]|nr:tetratricopeptide repeat protein [Clostridium sp.]
MQLELISACEAEDLDKAKQLVESGADLEQKNENGQTPLFIAVKKNNLELASYLMEKGADLNARENTMLTPWLCAGANGFHKILKEALKYNPDIKSSNRFGGTVLLPSSEKGYLKTVEVGLDAGVPVNHVNDLMWSALQEAVILGNGGYLYRDILRRLIDAGADVNLKDNDGKNVLDYAKERKQERVLAILEKREAQWSEDIKTIREMILSEDYINAKELLVKGIEDEYRDLELYYLLGEMYTRQENYEEALKVYLFAAKLPGGSPEFLFHTANTLRSLKRSDEALKEYEKAVEMDPEDFFYRYHMSNYLRELGKHEEAIKAMDILLENDPNRYDYLFHKANSLRSLGRHEESAQAMDRAIKADPKNSLYIFHKAQSQHLLGENNEALELLEKALSMKKSSVYEAEKKKVQESLKA